MDILEKVQSLPLVPGVYLMKDAQGGVIYVGKSKCLRKRVQSYFYNNKSHPPKIKKLVHHVKDLEVIQTDTEFEAFMLECSLIHRYKPMYNRKMKNPKSYSYITIPQKEGLRRIEVTHLPSSEVDRLVFGPYTASRNTVEQALLRVQEIFRIACSHAASGAVSPCLNHSLGLCLGMCLGGEGLQQYNQLMNRLIGLLDGSDSSLLDDMEQQMAEAAAGFDFERAAKYRDAIQSVHILRQKERVIGFAEENRNMVIYEALDEETIKLFLIKRTTVLYSGKFHVRDRKKHLRDQLECLVQAYFKLNETAYAAEVGRDEIDEAQIIYSYLQQQAHLVLEIPNEWLVQEGEPRLVQELDAWLSKVQENERDLPKQAASSGEESQNSIKPVTGR